ncbi:hypothetical protein Pcinc_022765 [Petrolisthes cinctipes]|uniref:Uncharacterized protein n=1 Tax=Petrolisthes cinctipes TaxID=88211 RepID=A0AAE1FEZ3_PETCI|nr:hypothetical protein Pcinc_022765 [Petrolisthes cinctipes]
MFNKKHPMKTVFSNRQIPVITHSNDTKQNLIATDQPKSCSFNDVASFQDVNEPTLSTSGFSEKKAPTPETLIRPLPKASSRKKNGVNKKKRLSAILTNTYIKNALENISTQKTHKAKKNLFSTTIIQRSEKSKLVHDDGESSEEEDSLCLVCMEPFSKSKLREV